MVKVMSTPKNKHNSWCVIKEKISCKMYAAAFSRTDTISKCRVFLSFLTSGKAATRRAKLSFHILTYLWDVCVPHLCIDRLVWTRSNHHSFHIANDPGHFLSSTTKLIMRSISNSKVMTYQEQCSWPFKKFANTSP